MQSVYEKTRKPQGIRLTLRITTPILSLSCFKCYIPPEIRRKLPLLGRILTCRRAGGLHAAGVLAVANIGMWGADSGTWKEDGSLSMTHLLEDAQNSPRYDHRSVSDSMDIKGAGVSPELVRIRDIHNIVHRRSGFHDIQTRWGRYERSRRVS